ncbi:MAG TPA: histidine phosphatase family protein [Myxococcales bacterium]|nr:histidine phosphatase family protein [Myxococcales bacterium]
MLLVRHGQASWFEENYDRLSSVGEAQSRLLGALWAARGVEVTRVFTGPRVRQIRSAELCGEAYAASGRRWPVPVALDDLDEMRIEPLFREQMPELFEHHAHLRALGDSLVAADGNEARAKIFDRLFQGVITMWVHGQIQANSNGVETWDQFRARVQRGLHAAQEFRSEGNLARAPSGRIVAVFTSAGVIISAAQRALGIDDERTLGLAWRLRNSSVSEFLFSDERWSLVSFNSVPHLSDPETITYR